MNRRRLVLPVLSLQLVLLPTAGSAQVAPPSVPLFEGLGTHHYPISTRVPRAQQYFDQGLRLTYAFNHEEAIHSFREAARLDPTCALCYWGIALALGPNINLPMAPEQEREAFRAIEEARRRLASATPGERALVEALARRYSADADPTRRAALDSAYARAMGEVARRYPDDLDVATLHAEALMDLSPWNYWTGSGEPRPQTLEIVRTLEAVLARAPNHPGACHFYIHAVEAVEPEKAVPCAERLAQLMPGAGHLVHMPAHIYIRVGRYADAVRHNEHAIHTDEAYIEGRKPQGVYAVGYYPHNIHFLWAVLLIQGRSREALRTADRLLEKVPLETVRANPPLELFRPARLYTLARFGEWERLLTEPAPPAELSFTTGVWHYARGLALARLTRPREAEAELARLRSLAAGIPAEQTIGINSARSLLQIAEHVLAGEIDAASGNFDRALTHLRAAVQVEDGLTYDEPPPWYAPVRQALGSVALRAGRAEEAERAFREDLDRFPKNGWSLHGLAAALRAQGRAREAEEAERQFREAWAEADVMPLASRPRSRAGGVSVVGLLTRFPHAGMFPQPSQEAFPLVRLW